MISYLMNMSHNTSLRAGIGLLAIAATGLAGEAPATTPAASPGIAAATPASSPAEAGFAERLDKFIHKSKQPAPWWKWGGDLRLRDEYLNNAITLDENAARNEQNYWRIRARWWNIITPITNLDLNVRLTWEGREWFKPSFRTPPQTGWEWAEGVFDNLNFKLTKPFDLPAALTVGRQDIIMGNGWLVLDGTPRDGSRTIYFDAARLTYEVKELKTTIDAIYIDQTASTDRWLPAINQNHFPGLYQTDQDERGVILNISNKSFEKTQIDGFFIYKNDERIIASGNDANLYTFGARVAGDLADHWNYRAEAAGQLGRKNGPSVAAFGANSRLSYLFKDPRNNQVRFSYEYLSGNDPDTPENEQFDLLWGRWPQWSELYIYSVIPEMGGRVADISNLHRIGPGWSFTPFKKAEFITDFYVLLADENTRRGAAGYSQDGSVRGELLTAVLKYRFNEHISGHLWSEFFFPGNYYDEPRKDAATFLRAELLLTW